jgi:hypothetical protein
MSNTDGHAKYHHMSGAIRDDPWEVTGANGIVYPVGNPNSFPVYTNAPGGHMCLFAPDDPCGL